MQFELDHKHQESLNNEIIKYFNSKTKIEIPDSMLNKYMENVVNDYKLKNKESKEEDIEKLKKEYTPQAIENIKWYLIRSQIINNEKIDITDKEVSDSIKKAISQNSNQRKEIESYYNDANNRDMLKSELVNKKLFEKLNEFSIVKVKEVSTDKYRGGNKK